MSHRYMPDAYQKRTKVRKKAAGRLRKGAGMEQDVEPLKLKAQGHATRKGGLSMIKVVLIIMISCILQAQAYTCVSKFTSNYCEWSSTSTSASTSTYLVSQTPLTPSKMSSIEWSNFGTTYFNTVHNKNSNFHCTSGYAYIGCLSSSSYR